MKVIWKFQVADEDVQTVIMPRCAAILTVMVQKGIICIWAEVDPDNETVKRTISMYDTGNSLPKNEGIYIGTIMHDKDNSIVSHVYDCGPQT